MHVVGGLIDAAIHLQRKVSRKKQQNLKKLPLSGVLREIVSIAGIEQNWELRSVTMNVNVPLGYVPWHIWLGSQPSHNQSRAHLVFWLKKGPFLAIFEMASSQQPSETETSYFQGYFHYIRGLQKCIWILDTKPLILGPLRNPWFSQFLLLDRTCMQLLANFIPFWKLHDLSYLWVENQQDKWLFHK